MADRRWRGAFDGCLFRRHCRQWPTEQNKPRRLFGQSGLTARLLWLRSIVRTSVLEAPVQEAPAVRRLNIYGDGQGDLAGHGGVRRTCGSLSETLSEPSTHTNEWVAAHLRLAVSGCERCH
jgi:hypothetical protein